MVARGTLPDAEISIRNVDPAIRPLVRDEGGPVLLAGAYEPRVAAVGLETMPRDSYHLVLVLRICVRGKNKFAISSTRNIIKL